MWQSPVASSGNDDLTDTKAGANKALKQKNIIFKKWTKTIVIELLKSKNYVWITSWVVIICFY